MATTIADDVLADALDAALANADTVSLHTGDPGVDGTANELVDPDNAIGYVRAAVTFAAASAGDKASDADAEFAADGGNWPPVTHFALWNSGGGPDFVMARQLVKAKQIDDGETLTIPTGELTLHGEGG